MKRVLIITGGKMDEDFALEFLCKEPFDHRIVVDGALAFWDRVCAPVCGKSMPSFDHLVGDFDTVSHDILRRYVGREDIRVHQFIPEKDYTDTDIAVRLAIDLIRQDMEAENPAGGSGQDGLPQIWLLGAMGTRMDHTLANIQLLDFIRQSGMEGFIADPYNRIRLIGEGLTSLVRSRLYGDFLSLVPLTLRLGGVTMKGFKYETEDLEVILGQTRCVSNEVTQENCSIEIREGMAFLIEARD